MLITRSRRATVRRLLRTGLLAVLSASLLTPAQLFAQPPERQPLMIHVSDVTQRLEMTANTSRVLTSESNIKSAQVNNPDVVQLTPLAPNQIQISALRAGVTQINLFDESGEARSMDVVVYGDAQELVQLLKTQFPTASLKVLPLQNSVAISGYVDNPQQVSQIVSMAQDYYPKVHNNISISGVQQVLLHVKVMEVSRTKLRNFGVDWAATNGSDFIVSSVSGLIAAASAQTGVAAGAGDTMRFGIVDGNSRFFGFIDALRQNDLAKILAEPTLVTVSGRPAYFQSGGEIPIQVPQSLGTTSIEYKAYGLGRLCRQYGSQRLFTALGRGFVAGRSFAPIEPAAETAAF